MSQNVSEKGSDDQATLCLDGDIRATNYGVVTKDFTIPIRDIQWAGWEWKADWRTLG